MISQGARAMTVGRDCFQRRPRSRRSSNEVAPSAGGGGGARDLRSRFSSSSPVRRGVASAAIGRSWPSFGLRILPSRSRCFASPASAVPLGTPTGVLQSLKGVGDGPNFLRGQAKKRWGLAKGAKTPWLRSLPTFCRITESRSPRGSSGLKEKVIGLPERVGVPLGTPGPRHLTKNLSPSHPE